MNFLITGADGFVGTNLKLFLSEIDDISVTTFTRSNTLNELQEAVKSTDAIIHLAGINRPKCESEFSTGNLNLTEELISAVIATGRKVPILYSSSIQAAKDNAYGRSKRAAEDALFEFAKEQENPVLIYRLANVFGKWCKPNYNSMVATFCHNIARDIEIQINDENAPVELVYIDDVVETLVSDAKKLCETSDVNNSPVEGRFASVDPVYRTTVGEVASMLRSFKESRNSLVTECVGTGFTRKLYSTYVSYLPTDRFTYSVPKYGDERGVFVEMLKTPNAGQFSFFTAHPGVTRGGHYHHTKTEKFLVIKGRASFRFRNMNTDEYYELQTDGKSPEIVETVPGWSHDITNIGDDELVVMLWANEIFDRENPDTYAFALNQKD